MATETPKPQLIERCNPVVLAESPTRAATVSFVTDSAYLITGIDIGARAMALDWLLRYLENKPTQIVQDPEGLIVLVR
jgi:hypothetical protein